MVVWAGMRGAVTVAAAQSLPADTPQRSVLILIAFVVALGSLVLQGGTLGWLLRLTEPKTDPAARAEEAAAERTGIGDLLREAAAGVVEPATAQGGAKQEGQPQASAHRLAVLAAQRSALLDARDNGVFGAEALANALQDIDATQIAIELRARHAQ